MSKKKIVTHNAGFHVDDIFGVATLLLLLGEENCEVVRSRVPDVIESGDYVLDVGTVYDPTKNRFDHHQDGGAGERSNGIPYASFGLIWKKFGEKLSGSEAVANAIDELLVQPVDGFDNGLDIVKQGVPGLQPYLLQNVVWAFEPAWEEKGRTHDEGFSEMVIFAKRILEREIIRMKKKHRAFTTTRRPPFSRPWTS